MYKMRYTGYGYPSTEAICKDALQAGFTHYYWASDGCIYFEGMYNGDTVVVYDSIEGMPASLKADAEKYGKPIE